MANKAIIFDSGTLISLEMAGLIEILKDLKNIFNGEFIITKEVKYEVIDRSIGVKRFELGALRINSLLEEGILSMPKKLGISDSLISSETKKIMKIANSTFKSDKREIEIIQLGETSCLVLSKILTEKGIENLIAIDERTTRILGEKPDNLKDLLQTKLHTKIESERSNYKNFNGFRFIRSAEIVFVAFKKGLTNLKDRTGLDALLYAVKFKGAAISGEEIKEIERLAFQ